ncbi:MAG: bifunctional UDP-N-acetylglucosamine diphosphorylase/glucosamine-1-phosphate N-acetyltransferase GlmU [Actinobacteria bacterium]|nr:bifunctional UDP-N-acetylglucosamine diphosphorylase/glucosamine-1-phosphate N-acetyltransferase GlmU [Actinomycetota bacterium]
MTSPARDDLAAVVLAAGLGTRFRSDRAKVMHPVTGRTMLRHVLEALRPLGLGQVVVVVGHQADAVTQEADAADFHRLMTVTQEEQRGTGHAARQALPALDASIRRVLVLPGDTPLVRPSTLERLADADIDSDAVLLSVQLDDPTGYGRLLHDDTGRVVGIVEETDATDQQRQLRHVNAGMYRFDRHVLADVLGALDADNVQGEQYLTDVVGILAERGHTVRTVEADIDEVRGVNDRVELAAAAAVLRRRCLEELMRSGVTVVDPATTYIDVGVTVGRDTVVLPGSILQGRTRVGDGATVGPFTRLVDAEVADGAHVEQSTVVAASIGPDVSVGPYAYLRPGTRLERGAKAGTFVEIKNSTVGEGSKVPHLSYVGDATIGDDVNVGAGTVTVNYDGYGKYETLIGDGAFIGSDSMLIAPVRIGDGAVTGAGSTITNDVPSDALAVARARQRNIDGWAARRRQREEGRGR